MIEQLLVARHPLPEWATFIELRAGVGFGGGRDRDVAQSFDVAAINTWSRKRRRVVYEVKRSRGDFLRELDNPDKRLQAETYFHECYFAVAPDVCAVEEVPEGWGLLQLTAKGDNLRRVRAAKFRTPEDMPETFVLMLLRRSAGQAHDAKRTLIFDGDTLTQERLAEIVAAAVSKRIGPMRDDLRRDQMRVRDEALALRNLQGELRRPLQTLALLAEKWSLTIDGETDVDALIDLAVRRRLKDLGGKFRAANEALTNIIEGMP